MFKILILSLALIFTACQKKSGQDDSGGNVGGEISQLGQKLYENQGQTVSKPGSIEGLWQSETESVEASANIKVTLRLLVEKNIATAAAKCEFVLDGTLVDTMYVGAEGPIEYTDSKITVGAALSKSLTVDGRSCRVSISAGTVNYRIDASSKIMSLCNADGDQCSHLTKIAD